MDYEGTGRFVGLGENLHVQISDGAVAYGNFNFVNFVFHTRSDGLFSDGTSLK